MIAGKSEREVGFWGPCAEEEGGRGQVLWLRERGQRNTCAGVLVLRKDITLSTVLTLAFSKTKQTSKNTPTS